MDVTFTNYRIKCQIFALNRTVRTKIFIRYRRHWNEWDIFFMSVFSVLWVVVCLYYNLLTLCEFASLSVLVYFYLLILPFYKSVTNNNKNHLLISKHKSQIILTLVKYSTVHGNPRSSSDVALPQQPLTKTLAKNRWPASPLIHPEST